MRVTTGDIQIRFPSADSATSAKAVYTQQRQPDRGNNSGLCHIKDITGKRAAIMIPNGVSKTDPEAINLSKAYLACYEFRGLANLQLQARMLKTVSDLYEASRPLVKPGIPSPSPPI